jgi:hypothetical protein
MTETSSPSLYRDVQERIATARARVEELDVSDDVKKAALRRLNRLDRASKFDLSIASREVAAFLADLDAGELPLYD